MTEGMQCKISPGKPAVASALPLPMLRSKVGAEPLYISCVSLLASEVLAVVSGGAKPGRAVAQPLESPRIVFRSHLIPDRLEESDDIRDTPRSDEW